MPQFSLPWPTNGTGDGASEYTSTQLITAFRRMFGNGVFAGYGDELAVTGTSSPLSVGYGAAVVNGFQYDATQDDAPYSIAVPTPTTGTTGHIVVVRADWTLQTVRLALRSSADGTAAFPAPVVNEPVVSEILLAQLTITTGGVITVTDARDFLYFHTLVNADMIDDRTRTQFVPVSFGVNSTDGVAAGITLLGVTLLSNKHTQVAAQFRCPADYASNLSVRAVIYSDVASGNMRYTIGCNYGSAGQAYTAHVAGPTTATQAVTSATFFEVGALSLASVATPDYVICSFERIGEDGADTAGDTICTGFLVSYTADS